MSSFQMHRSASTNKQLRHPVLSELRGGVGRTAPCLNWHRSFRLAPVRAELPESSTSSSDSSDEDSNKVARIDLNAAAAEQGVRRTVLVGFTCNKCNGRTNRLVNPIALKRGTVWVQCGGCEAWHMLVDNLDMVEEYRLDRVTGEWNKIDTNMIKQVRDALGESAAASVFFEAGAEGAPTAPDV